MSDKTRRGIPGYREPDDPLRQLERQIHELEKKGKICIKLPDHLMIGEVIEELRSVGQRRWPIKGEDVILYSLDDGILEWEKGYWPPGVLLNRRLVGRTDVRGTWVAPRNKPFLKLVINRDYKFTDRYGY